MQYGAQSAGKELGISIYVRGALSEMNTEGQIKAIHWVLKNGCRGLLLAPNSTAQLFKVADIKTQGIPTVYIDRDMGGERISVIKTNNYEAGKLAGKEMVNVLKGKGGVAVFRLNKFVASTTARENGFIHAATEGGLNVVVDEYVGATVGDARDQVHLLMIRISQFDGIFTPNKSTTMGTILALENLDLAGKFIHIGFDSSDLMIEALETSRIYGFIVQRPYQMGYQGVHTLYDAMQGKPIRKNIETPVTFVNIRNVIEVNER